MTSAGRQGRGPYGSSAPSISADGRFVAFQSGAALVAGDTNRDSDVFVRDRKRRRTIRVSVSSQDAQVKRGSSSYSTGTAISADGRLVAFASSSSRLVPADTNRADDVFLRDLTTGTTTRVSVSSSGEQADGACPSTLSSACAASSLEALSADGNTIVFSSASTNLVAGDTNRASDVFTHDRRNGATTRVSVDSTGAEPCPDGQRPGHDPRTITPCASQTAAVSSDGRYTVFTSEDPQLDRVHDYWPDSNSVSLFVEDVDVFLHDAQTGSTERASVGTKWHLAVGPALSADGRFVAFVSAAPALTGRASAGQQVFVRGPLH